MRRDTQAWRTMMILLLWLLLCSRVYSANIIPAHVDTPNGFGPGFVAPKGCVTVWDAWNGAAIECDLAIPPGTYEIAGWSGYIVDLFPFFSPEISPAGYTSIQVWHDGGTPHLLSQPHWGAGIFPFPDVFYPAGDGHATKPGDRVFAVFRCTGFAWNPAPPLCAAGLIVHYRVAKEGVHE